MSASNLQSLNRKIPVILDTDIGTDIDDTWALALALKSPELKLKLVTASTGDTTYRVKIAARLLEVAGRTDVPIGIGPVSADLPKRQEAWVRDYNLARYPGKVHADGAKALVRTVMGSREPVTLVGIGPLTTVAAALAIEPGIAARCRFVGMHGSLRRSHRAGGGTIAEYNVAHDVPAAQAVFAAPWREVIITPLDTCAFVRLRGEKYRAVCAASDTVLRAVIENYRIWLADRPDEGQTSILFDTVAVYLAFASDLLVMEPMGIRVTDDGFTVKDPQGRQVNCAIDWKDLPGFEDFLVARLQ